MGMGAVFKRTSGHRVAIMVLVWFTCLAAPMSNVLGVVTLWFMQYIITAKLNCEMNFKGWTL